jgi:addiction module HigA family antidote
MLLEEFLKPLGISQSAFAIRLGVSFPRLNEIVRGRRSVTPDTALRLAQVTRMSADFWLGLQSDWDLWHALRSKDAARIGQLEPLASLAGVRHSRGRLKGVFVSDSALRAARRDGRA